MRRASSIIFVPIHMKRAMLISMPMTPKPPYIVKNCMIDSPEANPAPTTVPI